MLNQIEKIWTNWQLNSEPCSECPDNDTKNYWYPLFGLGNWNADTMVVCDTPAYNIENIEYRYTKNHLTESMIIQDFKTFAEKLLQERLDSNTNILIKILKSIVLGTNLTVHDLYFTNIKKCGNISRVQNHEAYAMCFKNFLIELEVVKPKNIILVGGKAFNMLNNLFKFTDETSVMELFKIPTIFNSHGYKILVVPHWGYYRRLGKIKEYAKKLNKLSRRFVC